jgi:uncharacterized RDD family membrane protein YckC
MTKYRRVLAFILDTLLVSLVTIMLATNPKVNKNYYQEEEYNKLLVEKQSSLTVDYNDPDHAVDKMYDEVGQVLYDSTKVQVYSLIIFMIVNTLYFVVFVFFNDGKTLGCALFKFKIVKKNNKKANLLNLSMRSLFMGSSFIYRFPLSAIFLIVLPRLLDVKAAFLPLIYINGILLMFEIALLIVFIVNKKGMTIQDYLSNTKIIDTKK